MLKDLVVRNRSYRRFYQNVTIGLDVLRELVNLARLSASGGNAQPLKYLFSCNYERNSLIFPHLGWAMHLKDWPGPPEGERPSAYIIILGDKNISKSFAGYDYGIAAQSILLGATEKDLGGCMLGAIRREALRNALGISVRYDILLVIALGKPKEQVVIDTVALKGDTRYWRDSHGIHHVPKRKLDDIIIT